MTPTLSVQAKEEYPYFPGQEPTLRGDADFLLEVSQRTSEMPHSFALEVALESPFVSEFLTIGGRMSCARAVDVKSYTVQRSTYSTPNLKSFH